MATRFHHVGDARGEPIGATLRTFETPGTDSQVMAIAHLDEDGLLDVITDGWDRPTLTILLGRAPGGQEWA